MIQYAKTNSAINDKLKRNLGLYGIVASNGLFNGNNLNEDDFNDFADNMPYFEGLGYYIDLSGLGEKLYESYEGQTVIKNANSSFIKEPSSIKAFNGANFLDVFAFGIAETLGFSTNMEGSVQIESNNYLDDEDGLIENLPKMKETLEENFAFNFCIIQGYILYI